MATGVGFSFDTSFLQNLEKADKKMAELMDTSNSLGHSVTSAFQKMTNSGVIPFVNELERKLQALNSIKMSIGDNADEQLTTLKDSASSAIDEINKLLNTLYKSQGYKLEVGSALDEKRYEDWLINKHREEKEHKRIEDEKTQATIEAINKQNAAYAEQKRLSDTDEKRYNDWLRQKEREVQDHEDAERRKHNATMNVIARQNAAYAEQAKMVEKKRQEYAKLYAGLSPNDINYLLSSSRGINPKIEFEQKQIKALTQAKFDLDKQDKNYVQTINSLDDAIARHKRNLQAITDALREQQREYEKNAQANRQSQRQKNTSYEGALDFSSRAKSINREKLAIQYLTEARNNLSKADADYQNKLNTLNSRIKQHNKNIQEATAGAKDLQEKHRGLMDTSGQLARAMAAVFSVSAIKGYVNKLMQIRGEFELQQRSLQVLLQNKDEANALWDKTVALAVKSPYTTKQLVTATKQLAAYRIESEKLYETNKMLADVSIGLGVDMNRLILAFGQVKAANFLRGTELRQFSEAGVNMLDELAKRFTELEGRAVSVAEVFDRISKRKVTFADVEAVFKEITSEGGMFYQMQEKQAETLKGQILNLRDSYELLLNSIGKKQEGAIKDVISSIKSLIDNWETYANIIKPLLTFIIARFGIIKAQAAFEYMTKQLVGFKYAMRRAEGGVKGFFAAFKKGMKTNWIGIILSIAAALYELFDGFASTSDAAGSVAESLAEFRSETDELIKNFEKYTDVLRDNTKTTDEQDEAVKRLRSGYKELIGEHNLEKEKLIEVSKEREKYIAILEKQRRLQEKQRMYDFVQNEYKVDTEALKDLFAIFEKLNKDFKPVDAFKKIEDLKKDIIEGTKTSEEAIAELKKYFARFSGTGFNDFEEGLFTGGLLPVIKGDADFKDAVSAYTKAAFNPLDAYNFLNGLSGIEDLFKNIGDVTIEYADAQDTATKRFNEFKSSLGDLTPTSMAALTRLVEKIKNEIEAVGEMPIGRKALDWIAFNNREYKEDLEKLSTEISQPINKAVVEVYDGVKEKNEELAKTVSESFLSGMLKGFNESTVDFKKRWDEAYDAAQNTVKEHKQGGAIRSFFISEEDLNEAKFVIAAYEQLFGKSNKVGGDINSTFDKRLQVIKEIHKAYKDLSKTLSDVEAKEGALAKYGNAFKEAFGKTVEEMGFDLYSENGLLSAIDYLIDNAPNVAKRIQAELAKGEITWETKIEVKQESDEAFLKGIEDMFSGYELSLELDKLNIPSSIAKDLFNIDTVSLSEISQKIQEDLRNLRQKGGNEDLIKELEKYQERVEKLEQEHQEKLLKQYSKYLVQAQSERIKIKLDELRQLKEIESLEIDEATKATMRQGVQQDTQRRLDNQAWRDFQDTDMYIQLFENMEMASKKAVTTMKNKLVELRGSLKNLDPTNLKAINEQIEKLEKIEIRKDAFGFDTFLRNAKKYIDFLKNRQKLESDYNKSVEIENVAKKNVDNQNLLIKKLEDEYQYVSKTEGVYSEEAKDLAIIIKEEKQRLNVMLAQAVAAGKISQEYADIIRKGLNAGNATESWLKERAKEIDAVVSSMADMATNLEAAFGMSDSLKDTFELLQGIVGGVSDMFSGVAGLFSGNPLQMIQGGMSLVGGVSKIFASFNEAHDKRIERKIESEIKLVERLGKLYEKLEKQIEAAYSIDTFQAANDAAKENLEEQIRATERMIEAEKDKKDTDWGRIEEWKEQIEEYTEMLDELEVKRLQELGGVGGEDFYKDAAQSFVDAWIEAFLATGDGLDGLLDEFDEFYKESIGKQLALRAVDAYLDDYFQKVDTWVDQLSQGRITPEEYAKFMERAAQEAATGTDAILKPLANAFNLAGTAEQKLGSLSAGIQGISESQADTIAAYLNSLRFYVADSNTQLKALVAAQVNTDTPNPMLSQLLVIAEQTRAIRDMFESVIGRGGNNKHGGAYLKVDIG